MGRIMKQIFGVVVKKDSDIGVQILTSNEKVISVSGLTRFDPIPMRFGDLVRFPRSAFDE